MTKILIIDDSETDRYICRRHLGKHAGRYEVHEARVTRQGLTLAEQPTQTASCWMRNWAAQSQVLTYSGSWLTKLIIHKER